MRPGKKGDQQVNQGFVLTILVFLLLFLAVQTHTDVEQLLEIFKGIFDLVGVLIR